MRQLLLLVLVVCLCPELVVASEKHQGPLIRDFVGINGHFPFRPELYRPVAGLVRNYHNMDWDVAKPGDAPTFPRCVNGVNWEVVYGGWKKQGFNIDLCAQFSRFGPANKDYAGLWQGNEEWAAAYGREMARFFGPTKGKGLVHSIEIGNEPGSEFDDALYRSIFRKMASGIREGDPAIKIVTCTAHAEGADKYHKSLDETFGDASLHPLFDVINIHTYAELPKGLQQHPWERTFPEDSRSPFLRKVDEAVAWRDRHVPGKEVWVTEFGWDSCTPEAMTRREGWAEKLKWTGVSDLEQAQYLVRSVLLLSARPVDRAYIYYYDDNDQPSVHASSGVTRKFQPKPSYWALRQLQETLGDCRFDRIVEEKDGLHIYAYKPADITGKKREIRVVWRSSGKPEAIDWKRGDPDRRVIEAYAMATTDGKIQPLDSNAVIVPDGSPMYWVME